jgi:DNA-binding response OmpR family regulator
VVRSLVTMHGGEVCADSAGPARGSSFTVRLPVSAPGASAPAPVASRHPSAGRRSVLLVEDNVDACNTLKTFLTGDGHEVAAANDGQAGLAAALARPYDVVLCDIGLPGLNGFDLIAALRSTPGAHQPFAIALSGYGQAEDRARGLAAGFDHYLVKPIDPDGLLALIASVQREGNG